LSTFGNSTLFEEEPTAGRLERKQPAEEKSGAQQPAQGKPGTQHPGAGRLDGKRPTEGLPGLGLGSSMSLPEVCSSQNQDSWASDSLISQGAVGATPRALVGSGNRGSQGNELATQNAAELATQNAAELATQNAAELATQNAAELASQDTEAKPQTTTSLLLVVPNKLTHDNIASKYLATLKKIIARYLPSPDDDISLSIQIRPVADAIPAPTDFTSVLPQAQMDNRFSNSPSKDARPFAGDADWEAPSQPSNGYSSVAGQKLPDLPKAPSFNPRFTFENFVSGSTNRFAYSATLGVAEHPGDYYNPLFIFGNVGLGKTHLLQAVANYVTQHYPQKRALYVATETFLNDFLEALKKRRGNQFREKYRQLDVLILDDIQVLEGKESTQEEIFHTFNYLYESNKQLIFSSDRPPDALQTLENRLRSRFKSGLLADIQPPDIETRLIILQQNVEHQNRKLVSLSRPIIDMPQDVLNFIAENFKENIRELEGALTKVMAHSQLMGVSPTLDSTSDLLGDLISHSSSHFLSPQGIIKLATEMFKLSQEELTGQSRKQELVMPRHITMYAIREHTDLSYPAIGEFFSNRDHSSVMHAVSKVKKQIKEKPEVYESVVALTSKINLARRSRA